MWEELRKLWKVSNWVQAVVLDGETVGEYLVIVGDDFVSGDPSFDEDAVLSDFAEDEVVVWVVAFADFDCGLRVFC